MARPDDLAHLAGEAAQRGGTTILQAATTGGVAAKGAGDYVTGVDRASERSIAGFLREAMPEVPVVGEELGGLRADRYWLVDPLDGTTNYLHGFPVVGVSVALIAEGRPVAGAVHAPFLGETYTAARGAGGRVERRDGTVERLRVSERPIERAIVATGFPFRNPRLIPRYLPVFEAALDLAEDLRRPGAASLDLAWVAAGVFDGFFELALSSWDVAAGALLVEEAGGVVSGWEPGSDYLDGDILAGNPRVHPELAQIVAG